MFEVPLLPRNLSAAERDLAHPRERVRLEAVRDLARWVEDPEERGARVELLGRASRDAALAVRKQALLALADLADARALPLVRPMLRETAVELRELAVLVIGECAVQEDEVAIGDVRPLLGASEPRLRFQALAALARLAPAERAGAVSDALRDPDAEVRTLALELVDELWPRSATPTEVLDGVERLRDELDPRARLLRELILAERGQASTTVAILEVVEGRVRLRSVELTARALEAAGRLRLEPARPGLERRAFSWSASGTFRTTARAALAALGDPRAVASMRKELAHKSRARAGSALLALVRANALEFRPEVERAYEEFAAASEDVRQELHEFLASC